MTTLTTRIFFLFFVLLGMNAYSQVTLEKSYDHSLTVTKINQTAYKFYLMDVANSKCDIYNLDHTLWKSISITLPANYYLFDIKFVTENLFNTDNSIEIWYSAYEYMNNAETGNYISGIINENKDVLVTTQGGLYAYILKAGEETYKLSVYAYDKSGNVKTHIYSLPSSSTAAAHVSVMLPDPYPNPATGSITLPLYENSQGGILQVSAINGQIMLEKKISGEPFLRLDISGWTPGAYTYRIVRGGEASVSKRFLIHKNNN